MSVDTRTITDAARRTAEAATRVVARRRPAFRSALSVSRQPFLYLTAALATGMLLDRWLEAPRWLIAPPALAAMAGAAGLILVKKATQATLALFIGLALAGAWLSLQERQSVEAMRLRLLFAAGVIRAEDPVELIGVLARPPEPAPDAFFLDLEAESLRSQGVTTKALGTVRLFISPGDAVAADEFKQLALDTGARLRVLVRLERANRYSNPGSPDFNDFLERRGYDLKGTIKSPLLIESLGRAKTNRALAWLYRLRIKLMEAIDARFLAPTSGTLKAMLAGNRYFLDAEVSERLRQSATFHTLVIAGLHMGILAWALLRVRWDFWRSRRHAAAGHSVARALAAIILLWAYAAMVGLAPPVVRATSMLTIGIIGPLLFRRAASINTVSLAAFVMLALKPAVVADPAFQLSFVAVAAIVALALPLIDRLKQIGEWRPQARSPHPPVCPPMVRALAEILFWDEREFRRESRRSPIRYRLDKSPVARRLNWLRLQPLARVVAQLVITSTAIQLATLPLMAVYFNRVSPIGILLNVTAGLLTAVLMLGGLAVLVIAPLSAPLAAVVAAVVNAAHTLLVHSVVPFAPLTFATFRVAHYEDWHALIYALYFVPLAGLAVCLDRWRPVDEFYAVERAGTNDAATRRRVPVSLCLVALLASTAAILRPVPIAPTGKLTVYFLDVGQGDAALVVFPHGTMMLVDAGGELQVGRVTNATKPEAAAQTPQAAPAADRQASDDVDAAGEPSFNDDGFAVGEAVVSRFLWSQRRTVVDYALATHADADHMAGFSQVMKNFRIGQCLIGHRPSSDLEYEQFARNVREQRIPLGALAAGQRFDIDGVTVEVLWPPRATAAAVTSANNDSVVLRLVYGDRAILMTGDIEAPAEATLVAASPDLRADVLKVPHHGSKTSSTDTFLDRVRPRCAIISVGERSRFGHPHAAVVERYRSRGIRLLETGRDGMVMVETDGVSLNISTFNSNR
ncbi:MAG: ComEC/Rec2 family competence protein [Blastocatellia bacterium]